MCGIFALLNYKENHINKDGIQKEFSKGKKRGPDDSKLDFSYLKMALGFHRLAINGLNPESNQPLDIDNIVLICNGEIYNYRQLFMDIGVEPYTGSDCEIIIHLYLKYGIEQTLRMIDGEYSFLLFDNRITTDLNSKIFVARDPYGVRPLYQVRPTPHSQSSLLGFASELKCIEKFKNEDISNLEVIQYKPGTYSIFNLSNIIHSVWSPIEENIPYIIPSFPHSWLLNQKITDVFIGSVFKNISLYLNAAVEKRCLATERPIACLLSGGLDSSLVAALVNDFYKRHELLLSNRILETYSIGLFGSEDLKYAKIVADYLGTKHTEIIVTELEMFEAIPDVIYAIESYDTTSVRASIGNYLLGKYISKNSDAKVIFNGDGADELFGGYLYMNKCPDDIEFDKETRRLLKDIHAFDVLRSDKCISSHGLEPRTAFLDRSLVDFVLSIPPYFRNHTNTNNCEKFILRNGFDYGNFTNYEDRPLLPDEILWRKKEAFSDGVSSQGRSLYKILQELIVEELQNNNDSNIGANIETEKAYYKNIFESKFPNCASIVPYYWMPKYTNATDPSARTLDFYHKTS